MRSCNVSIERRVNLSRGSMQVRAGIDCLPALGDDPAWLSMGGKPAMKLAPRAENLMERIALMANLAPRPLLDTQIAFTAARAIMAAAEVGLFEALGKGDQTAEAVAAVCGTDPKATKH